MTDRSSLEQDEEAAPRIALPKTIAQTLRYLDDIDLETLRVSVDNELKRRRTVRGEPQETVPAPPSLPSGKANLIRASFASGMKPQAIARTLRLSVAQVNEVLRSDAKRRS